MSDYATDVEGLPKTDFQGMRSLAADLIEMNEGALTRFQAQLYVPNGIKAGAQLFELCADLENTIKRENFNVFAPIYGPNASILSDTVIQLSLIYYARACIAQGLAPEEAFSRIGDTDLMETLSRLVDVAEMKDREYGASWCKRGGIGAWFTTVRKFDRIQTQLKQQGFDVWKVDDTGKTESLDETLLDAINYLLLIMEKKEVIAGITVQ